MAILVHAWAHCKNYWNWVHIHHDQVHLAVWWHRSCTRSSPASLGTSKATYVWLRKWSRRWPGNKATFWQCFFFELESLTRNLWVPQAALLITLLLEWKIESYVANQTIKRLDFAWWPHPTHVNNYYLTYIYIYINNTSEKHSICPLVPNRYVHHRTRRDSLHSFLLNS